VPVDAVQGNVDIGTPLARLLLCYWNHVNSLNAFSKSAESMLGRLI